MDGAYSRHGKMRISFKSNGRKTSRMTTVSDTKAWIEIILKLITSLSSYLYISYLFTLKRIIYGRWSRAIQQLELNRRTCNCIYLNEDSHHTNIIPLINLFGPCTHPHSRTPSYSTTVKNRHALSQFSSSNYPFIHTVALLYHVQKAV
jgi:hypothetical protein